MKPESDIRNLAVVLGDPDQPIVGYKSEALQQVLSKPELERRVHAWAIGIERAIGAYTGIVKPDKQVCSRVETLLITEVASCSALLRYRRAGKNVVRNSVVVIELQRPAHNRIKASNEWPESFGAGQPQRSCADATGSCASPARARSDAAA